MTRVHAVCLARRASEPGMQPGAIKRREHPLSPDRTRTVNVAAKIKRVLAGREAQGGGRETGVENAWPPRNRAATRTDLAVTREQIDPNVDRQRGNRRQMGQRAKQIPRSFPAHSANPLRPYVGREARSALLAGVCPSARWFSNGLDSVREVRGE